MSWPAEIDVFLAIGELALYVAYLDAWPARQRVWPWATALIGLSVSVAGNIGHIQPAPGHPAILADRLTAATSPLAAFAGLYVGLLVLKMTRLHIEPAHEQPLDAANQPEQLAHPGQLGVVLTQPADVPAWPPARPATAGSEPTPARPGIPADSPPGRHGLLREATRIYQAAAANGDRISQRPLARQLRRAVTGSPTSTCTASPRPSA
jgi:hypothetical protein